MNYLLEELDEKELTLWIGGGWIMIEINGQKKRVWGNEETYNELVNH